MLRTLRYALRALRYTRIALLVFGIGLVLGFAIVVGEFTRFQWVASTMMALGLAGLPVGLVADGRALAVRAWIAARLPRGRNRANKNRNQTKPRPQTRPPRPTAARRRLPARAARGRRA